MRPILPFEPTPVTVDDLGRMLELFADIDGHDREDGAIASWLVVARAARWTRAQVAAAALTIAAEWTGFRIKPGDVTTQIRKDRERIRQAWYCPDPPRKLGDNPAAEIAWRRRVQADFAERALYALATHQPMESVPQLREPEPDPVSALPAAEQSRRIEELASTFGRAKAVPDNDDDADRCSAEEQLRRWTEHLPAPRVELEPSQPGSGQ